MRICIRIRGAVQGVGFRPHVFRLARRARLAGFVLNSPQGVLIEAEGPEAAVLGFARELQDRPPALAVVESFETSRIEELGETDFVVAASSAAGAPAAYLLPDLAMCGACRQDLFTAGNRRFRYPFTTCAHCGPRYSIVESLPYDRANTAMRRFPMCPRCQAEYSDPADRRFHAETICCPDCGPQLELWAGDGALLAQREEALGGAAAAIRDGRIVAVKGLGGFHLACDATSSGAVRELRKRKKRPSKPFAVMLEEHDEPLLHTSASPIVLVEKKPGLAEEVAPDNPLLGVMIPYSPLHALLMAEVGRPIVATSGNLSDEPICTGEQEALRRLRGIADLFLVHDRPILRPVDDSIVRRIGGEPVILRRARGYAPLPLQAARPLPEMMATGGQMKNTVAFSRGGLVFVSQHLGDLSTAEALAGHRRCAGDFQRIYGVRPARALCDAHPDYGSTKTAADLGVPLTPVQHHVAHAFSAVLEHGLAPPVLAAAWDGTGYGPGGAVWGGEFLLWEGDTVRRVAHLRPFRLPGGEQAIREPRRALLGVLAECGQEELARPLFAEQEWRVLLRMLERGVNAPLTTSAGRLFDAAAALLGLCVKATFEGEAAMRVEFAARGAAAGPPPETGLDWAPVFDILARPGLSVAGRAWLFHQWLAAAIAGAARLAGARDVALTGGCFQNALLAETAATRLQQAGHRVFLHRRLPPNDGGLAAGQILAAAMEVKLDVPGNPGADPGNLR